MEDKKELIEIGGWVLIDPSKIIAVNKSGSKANIFLEGTDGSFAVDKNDWERAEKYMKIWC